MEGSSHAMPEALMVQVKGATLSGVRRGTGGAAQAVFLHEGIADHRSWAGVLDLLAPDMDVVAYDRRGFGTTTYEAEAHDQVVDLLAVLDATGIERALVVGASMGGRVAIDFTLTHPDRVAALVVVAPAVSGAPEPEVTDEEAAFWTTLEAADKAGDLPALNRGELRLWLDGLGAPEGRVGGELRALASDMNAIALAAKSPGHEPNVVDAWNRLGEIGCPVLVVVGDLDMSHVQRRCHTLAERISGAELHVMEDAAHMVAFERPVDFVAVLRGFVARHL
jgi:pimeloyl-ACP methyl ester carboxylesterase